MAIRRIFHPKSVSIQGSSSATLAAVKEALDAELVAELKRRHATLMIVRQQANPTGKNIDVIPSMLICGDKRWLLEVVRLILRWLASVTIADTDAPSPTPGAPSHGKRKPLRRDASRGVRAPRRIGDLVEEPPGGDTSYCDDPEGAGSAGGVD